MSKPRTSKPSTSTSTSTAPTPNDDVEDTFLEPVTDPNVEITTVTRTQRRMLGRVMRFLVSIQTHDYVRRARRVGYSEAEHREGWGLWRRAAGEDRPLDHYFTEQQLGGGADYAALLPALQEIDTFENTWFPRTRAIIRRVVPAARRAEFAAAFFHDLEQQPLGPGVIGSVSKYLVRVDSLATTALPGAKEVRETLARRGLTEMAVGRMREVILALMGPPSVQAPMAVSPADIERAQRAQLEAFEGLRDWFNDWATMLRSVFSLRDRIQLGLTIMKRRGAAGEEVIEEEGEDEDDMEVEGAGRPEQAIADVA